MNTPENKATWLEDKWLPRSPVDWVGDYAEHGCYQSECPICLRTFHGSKKRSFGPCAECPHLTTEQQAVRLRGQLSELRKTHEDLRMACAKQDGEICDLLSRQLDYPWYKDDQKNFPGATDADGCCWGEHVAITLVMEAAERLRLYNAKGNGHDQPCYYCQEKCNSFAGNPGKWPIPLTHRDDPGRVKWHHIECVSSRLVENQTND